jgi:hypothetical protein
MVRAGMIILGIGLIIMWLVGLGQNPGWLVWLDFVAGILSIAGAFTIPSLSENLRVATPFLLAAGLFLLWLISLAVGGIEMWKTWWTFVFACAYTLLGVGAAASPRATTTTTPRMV